MKLKLLRIANRLTQCELAELVGVTPKTIIKIEKGFHDNVKLGTLKKVAEVLGTTVQELFFSEEER